jgi:phage regulator Rha-like protein
MKLVTIKDGQAVTTSEVIAANTDNQHKNVLELVKQYQAQLEEFAGVAFETRSFKTPGGTQKREVALLNEPQATFLLTLMRNSEIVVKFKLALVKAFFALRAEVESTPHRSLEAIEALRFQRAITMAIANSDRIIDKFPNMSAEKKLAVVINLVNDASGREVLTKADADFVEAHRSASLLSQMSDAEISQTFDYNTMLDCCKSLSRFAFDTAQASLAAEALSDRILLLRQKAA